MNPALDQWKAAHSWMRLAIACTQMSLAASEVIVRRSIRISQGAMTASEAVGMVLEKATAFTAAAEGAAVAAAAGRDAVAIASAALRPIQARARSNVRKYRR
jgi:hypothetical protein